MIVDDLNNWLHSHNISCCVTSSNKFAVSLWSPCYCAVATPEGTPVTCIHKSTADKRNKGVWFMRLQPTANYTDPMEYLCTLNNMTDPCDNIIAYIFSDVDISPEAWRELTTTEQFNAIDLRI